MAAIAIGIRLIDDRLTSQAKRSIVRWRRPPMGCSTAGSATTVSPLVRKVHIEAAAVA
jgi:hypothetical protein